MRLTVLITTALFVFSVVPGICFGQNRVVVIPLGENEAIGNARSKDVLKNKTFSCDEGSGHVGAMPNKRGLTFTPRDIDSRYQRGIMMAVDS